MSLSMQLFLILRVFYFEINPLLPEVAVGCMRGVIVGSLTRSHQLRRRRQWQLVFLHRWVVFSLSTVFMYFVGYSDVYTSL